MRQASGITLIELMLAIAILAILVTVAIPSFQSTIINNRITTQANNLLSELSLARSEAIKRGARVAVCRRNSAGSDCSHGANWEDGWIIFLDPTADYDVENADQILQVHAPVNGGVTLRANSNISNGFAYVSTGLSRAPAGLANGTISVCHPDAAASRERAVTLNTIGRARVVRPPPDIGCP